MTPLNSTTNWPPFPTYCYEVPNFTNSSIYITCVSNGNQNVNVCRVSNSPDIGMPREKKQKDDIKDGNLKTEKREGFRNKLDSFLDEFFSHPATSGMILGSMSGYCSGYLYMKLFKVIAVAVGGGIILLQLGNRQGYITVNWDKVYNEMDNVMDRAEGATGRGAIWINKACQFADDNIYLVIGFFWGFVLAMATS